MSFVDFKESIDKQITKMSKGELFTTNTSKDELWATYLAAYPEGTNPLYITKTEHDCNCCKSFIRNIGGVVSIVGGKVVSVWDAAGLKDEYKVVAAALSSFVKQHKIEDLYRNESPVVGTDHNFQGLEDGSSKRWDHFWHKLDRKFVMRKDEIPSFLGDVRANKDVLKRSIVEISDEAVDIVLDLIAQKSIYRGAEHLQTVQLLKKLKAEFAKTTTDVEQLDFLWKQSLTLRGGAKIRNTVIGSLLTDLSEGVDLEQAVKSFEVKVAPSNYKRPTALVTAKMISGAEAKVKELGIEESLQRRPAVAEDLTINNVLFADRTTKQTFGVFDALKGDVKTSAPDLSKVQDISVADFVKNVLPSAETIEVLFDNKHTGNLFSLVAPMHKDSPNLFKWDNNFSWSYAGEVTDSIKERVKAAGGSVTGEARISLAWFNHDDLDLHVVEPNGYEIYFGNRSQLSSSGGKLDVDMNAGVGTTRSPVENVTYAQRKTMKEGKYKVVIHNFRKRENKDEGFVVEFEYLGKLLTFTYDKPVRDGENVVALEFEYKKDTGVTVLKSLPCKEMSKDVWGISTMKFHKVTVVMDSPNFWDGQTIGNKHLFFVVDGCKNPDDIRTIYNEFLTAELNEHRKVFELLGGKLKTKPTENQLSGLGFSSTIENELVVKVGGSFNRMLKIKF